MSQPIPCQSPEKSVSFEHVFQSWLSIPESENFLRLAIEAHTQNAQPLVFESSVANDDLSAHKENATYPSNAATVAPSLLAFAETAKTAASDANLASPPPASPSALRSKSPSSPTTAKSASPNRNTNVPFARLPLLPASPPRIRRDEIKDVDGRMVYASPVRTFPAIKQFYFPHGVPPTPKTSERSSNLLVAAFSGHPDGLNLEQFFVVTTSICQLPSFMNSILFKRIDSTGSKLVSLEIFSRYWSQELRLHDPSTRLFRILQDPSEPRAYLTPSDFEPFVYDVVERHPGLAFLRSSEFRHRYVEAVITRLFYQLNRPYNERLTLREFKKSKLFDTMLRLDQDDDINDFNDDFSYEHFYVIYLKFWHLDTDHNFSLSREDLANYDGGALSPLIIHRIFSSVVRRPGCPEDRMDFRDFVVFFIAEVNKSSPTATEYWFRCLDLDGDGVVSLYEIDAFFQPQRGRLIDRQHCTADDAPRVSDVMCQLNDMVKPAIESRFTLRDIKHCRQAALFFDTLFNTHRYLLSEHKDLVAIQRQRMTPHFNDWDRYAEAEYASLTSGVQVPQETADTEYDLQELDDMENEV